MTNDWRTSLIFCKLSISEGTTRHKHHDRIQCLSLERCPDHRLTLTTPLLLRYAFLVGFKMNDLAKCDARSGSELASRDEKQSGTLEKCRLNSIELITRKVEHSSAFSSSNWGANQSNSLTGQGSNLRTDCANVSKHQACPPLSVKALYLCESCLRRCLLLVPHAAAAGTVY